MKAKMKREAVLRGKQAKVARRMADWMALEYANISSSERRAKIIEAIGDSPASRSFLKRLLPQFYDDVYGEAKPSEAFSHSVSAHAGKLQLKYR